MKKIHNANSWEDGFFASCMCFFDVFEKVKKCIFALNFLKTGPTDFKMCAKKLAIGPDLHQKFHQNQVISQKYTILQKGFIFFSPHGRQFYDN